MELFKLMNRLVVLLKIIHKPLFLPQLIGLLVGSSENIFHFPSWSNVNAEKTRWRLEMVLNWTMAMVHD